MTETIKDVRARIATIPREKLDQLLVDIVGYLYVDEVKETGVEAYDDDAINMNKEFLRCTDLVEWVADELKRLQVVK